jgi:hypothetical protein
LGFQAFGHYADYYEDGAGALRLELDLPGAEAGSAVP